MIKTLIGHGQLRRGNWACRILHHGKLDFRGQRQQAMAFSIRSGGSSSSSMEAMVTCLPGLEDLLSSELKRLGLEHTQVPHGAKLHQPQPLDLFRCHLLLGTASNILIKCGGSFVARGLAELRRKTKMLPWHELLSPDGRVRLEARVSTSKSKLYHTAAIEARVVAGAYEALGYDYIPDVQQVRNYPPDIKDDDPVVKLDVQIVRDRVDIWLYASPTPLHRRGYRLETSKAPLREDIAFAMLLTGGWHREERQYDLLLDPMCGSGTIAIEGAAMSSGLAPGRFRPSPLRGTNLENDSLHQELLEKQQEGSNDCINAPFVFASDRDAGAVKAAQANAERAGVLEYMEIQECAISAQPIWTQKSAQSLLVVTNPPFGNRVSTKNDISSLLPLYQSLLNLLRDRGNTKCILLGHGIDVFRRAGWIGETAFRTTHGGLSVSTFSSTPKKEPVS